MNYIKILSILSLVVIVAACSEKYADIKQTCLTSEKPYTFPKGDRAEFCECFVANIDKSFAELEKQKPIKETIGRLSKLDKNFIIRAVKANLEDKEALNKIEDELEKMSKKDRKSPKPFILMGATIEIISTTTRECDPSKE